MRYVNSFAPNVTFYIPPENIVFLIFSGCIETKHLVYLIINFIVYLMFPRNKIVFSIQNQYL